MLPALTGVLFWRLAVLVGAGGWVMECSSFVRAGIPERAVSVLAPGGAGPSDRFELLGATCVTGDPMHFVEGCDQVDDLRDECGG